MSTLKQDFSFGFRLFRKHPGFAAGAVLTLAIAMAANTAVFSLVNGVLWHRFSIPEVERVVFLWESEEGATVSPLNYLDWKDQASSFSGMAAYDNVSYTLTGDGTPLRLPGLRVAPGFLSVVGVRPVLGSGFSADVDEPGRDRQALIGHSLWQQSFAGQPGIVGRQLRLDGDNYEVVGVLPADFAFPGNSAYALVTPLVFTPGELSPPNRGAHWIGVLARLKPGVAVDEARAEMTTIAARLAELYPDTNSAYTSSVVPFREQFVGDVRVAILLLFVAVAAVLLIACVNLANLMLARAAGRRSEFGVRTALGASRLRIVRQLLCESLTLGALAGGVGLVLAYWGIDLLVRLAPEGIPLLDRVGVDARVVAFTFGVSLLAGLVFGLLPAFSLSSGTLARAISDLGRSISLGRSQTRAARLLVVAEVAVSLVLLIGAGLLLRSLLNISAVDPGFSTERAFTFRLSLPDSEYPTASASSRFYEQLAERLEALPGVSAVGATMYLPLSGVGGAYSSYSVEGRERPPDGQYDFVHLRPSTPGYIDSMGVPLLSGRGLTASDQDEAEGVVLINQAMAREVFPDSNPVGQRVRPHVGMALRGRWATVVGVVGDVRHHGLNADPTPEVYIPHPQQPASSMSVVVRTELPPESLMPQARAVVADLDANLPIQAMRTLEELYAGSFAPARFRSLLVSAFAVAALALSAIGLYGVIAYSVGRRAREFGIRMALGADRSSILVSVLSGGLMWSLIGVGLGLVLALGVTRYMESLLFGVEAVDIPTFAVLSLVLLAVAALASYFPARRATRLDPLETLRYE